MSHYTLKYVDHTYRDFSRYVDEGGQLIKHKKSENNFPARLHKILSEPKNSHVITWMPHGRAWKILDKERLISEVIPNYYVCKKYESFTRQLNGWGFKRLHQSGPDFGCFYQESFLRDLPELTCLIRRLAANLGKSTPFAKGEPNFYKISEKYPLPPLDSSLPPLNSSTNQESRTRAASLDSSMALPAPARARTRFIPDDITREIHHLSSLSTRPSYQETSAPAGATVIESSTPEASANQARYYHPPSDHSYSQHPPYSTNYASSYNDGQYYCDRYPSQGQLYPRSHYYPVDPHAQIYSNRAPIASRLSSQYSSYSQESHLNYNLNAYARSYSEGHSMPSSSDFSCIAHLEGTSYSKQSSDQENVAGKRMYIDPLEPIPIVCPPRQVNGKTKKDSNVISLKMD